MDGLDEVPDFQSENWSCGLACVAAITNLNEEQLVNDFQRATANCGSVWTPDLLFLLPDSARLYSTSLVIDPHFAELAYYRKRFETDRARVTPLLDRARDQGRALEKKFATASVPGMLETHHCICLVDKSALGGFSADGYSGHYVLLLGYEDGVFSYWDPDRTFAGLRHIDERRLDEARAVDGTDWDIVFVPKT